MIKMENKYKIVLNYIKDLTVEIPNPDALITTRNNISKYFNETIVRKADISGWARKWYYVS